MTKVSETLVGKDHRPPLINRELDLLISVIYPELYTEFRGKTVAELRDILGPLTVEEVVKTAENLRPKNPAYKQILDTRISLVKRAFGI